MTHITPADHSWRAEATEIRRKPDGSVQYAFVTPDGEHVRQWFLNGVRVNEKDLATAWRVIDG